MKDSELRLVSELLKNSRRSDRELAKAISVSQPTVSRTIKRLEKAGIIKEYTAIPDFNKLGFHILAITFLVVNKEPDQQEIEKTFDNVLMVAEGTGLNYSFLVVSVHENYGGYADFARKLKQKVRAVTDSTSFLVNLYDGQGFFSFSAFAEHLLKTKP